MKLLEFLFASLLGRGVMLVAGLMLALVFFLQVYPREHLGYNPMLDPELQLSQAVNEARQSNKDILIMGGGDWCSWCWRLKELLDDHPELNQQLHEAFVVEKVFWRQPSVNQAFINQFSEMHFAPFLMLLDDNKQLLMAKPAGDFLVERRGEGYSAKRLQQFIHYWQKNKQQRLANAQEASR